MAINHKWRPDEDELLRKLWEEGHTSTHISGVFGYTKNSIVGRAHKLGLSKRVPGNTGGVVKLASEQKRKATHGRPSWLPLAPKRHAPPQPVKPAVIDEHMEPVSIVDIKEGQCRSIVTMPTETERATMCGLPVVELGQSWCPGHRKLYYAPAAPRLR